MGQRPAHVRAPAYLSKNPPVPQPAPLTEAPASAPATPEAGDRLEPTRYGDWERQGIAVDF